MNSNELIELKNRFLNLKSNLKEIVLILKKSNQQMDIYNRIIKEDFIIDDKEGDSKKGIRINNDIKEYIRKLDKEVIPSIDKTIIDLENKIRISLETSSIVINN